jgi:hypothetical protein
MSTMPELMQLHRVAGDADLADDRGDRWRRADKVEVEMEEDVPPWCLVCGLPVEGRYYVNIEHEGAVVHRSCVEIRG